jgi:RNA polymerase sigma-70 factor (ECF subfamily)
MAKPMLASAAARLPSADEDALVEQARAGDRGAFSRLVTRYQDRILNTCWRVCGNLEDAQDLTQEAFLQAMEKIESFQQRASFYTWVFRIAVNLSISHRRRAARTPKLSLHDEDGRWTGDQPGGRLPGRASDEPDDPPARLSARETQEIVLDGLEKLDDEHRTVIVLKDIEGFDYQQIGEILELPLGTVKSRLHRARLALRDHLKPILAC